MRALVSALMFGILCNACGGGGSSITPDTPTPIPTQEPTAIPTAEPTATPEPTPIPTQGPDDVLISGTVSFEKVPHNVSGGLDYDSAYSTPARGIRVSLLNSAAQTLFSTTTDSSGNYMLIAPSNTQVRVVADAVMQRSDAYQWNFSVVDNTSSAALYSLSGSLISSGSSDSTRDLHAPSGWNTLINDYSDISTRPAAPFAILDAIYQAMALLMDAEDSFDLPACNLNWSYRNNTVAAENADGDIGTTFYYPSEKAIYVLGDADVDTDEYDFSVIQHEFSHFIEDVLSRSDSWGGSHNLYSQLDMRLAFSEGMANAFTAMASGTGKYFDSGGNRQASGFELDLESNTIGLGSEGWFSENSVGKVLYDIFDTQDDGADAISLGFGPVYDTITHSDFTSNSAFTSIFLFADVFSAHQPSASVSGLTALLAGENINSLVRHGTGESNNGGLAEGLPVYALLSEGSSVSLCGTNQLGEFNALGVSRFVRFNLSTPGSRTLTITRTSGGATDPDAYLFRNGDLVNSLISETSNLESDTLTLATGEYVLEVFDYFNSDEDSGTGGDSCFSVSLN